MAGLMLLPSFWAIRNNEAVVWDECGGNMIRLGESQVLVIVKKVDFGVYLAVSPEEDRERVLLPARQVPEGSSVGDRLEVFIYRDSEDRLIATTRVPKLQLGRAAVLKVVQTG